MTTLDIPADWRSWIASNRARGCSEASMLDAMTRGGIDVTRARTWLDAVPPASQSAAAQVGAGETYHYGPSRLPARNEVQLDGLTLRIAMRLSKPDVALIENFLTAAECDELVALAQARLQPSTVVDPDTGKHVPNSHRSSEGTMFQRGELPLIARVEQRIADLVQWPVDKGEGLQVLHYLPGGEYRPHFDYFRPELPGSALQMRSGGQRIATLIMYLNDVPGGGATIFPDVGLDIAPRKGSAVWFSYCNEAGQLDPATLHGGAPVLSGEKWIMTKWLRQRAYA